MRLTTATGLVIILLSTQGALPARAEQATPAEALAVAENYLDLLIHRFGRWGEHSSANVKSLGEFRRGKRLLGYVAQVEPEGYLVVSAQKELAAVKAHSATGRLDQQAEGGASVLLGDLMEDAQIAIENRYGGPIQSLTEADWNSTGATNYRDSWIELTAPDFEASRVTEVAARPTGSANLGYQPYEFLITSDWHQGDPYNRQTPSGTTCEHTLVGCVATAGAQIMRYWSWPPAAEDDTYTDHYRWSSMPDVATETSSQEEIDAVSAASWMVANALNMNFGCTSSGSLTADMETVLEHRRYDTGCKVVDRYDWFGDPNYSDAEWFQKIKEECNINRPLQYRIDAHSIIADGWYEIAVAGTLQRWYHMNYGWSVGDNTWYLMDVIPLGDPSGEYIVRNIRPDVDLGPTLSGTYTLPTDPGWHFDKPTRYFDQNASGTNASFAAGHNFQYVRRGVWLQNTGTGSDEILFQGTPGAATEIYENAPANDVRIRINDGVIRLKAGGEIALH